MEPESSLHSQPDDSPAPADSSSLSEGKRVAIAIGVFVAFGLGAGFVTLMVTFFAWWAGLAVCAACFAGGVLLWRRGRSPTSRPTSAGIAMASVAVGVLLSPVWGSGFSHDRRLADLKHRLCEVAVPPQTTVEDCGGSISLTSNGNHCDYEASMVIRSRRSRHEVLAFYRETPLVGTQDFPLEGAGTEGETGIAVQFLFDDPESKTITATVRVYDPGYPAESDVRCT